ncbi:hypothetical protein [Pontibacillus halophilus]|nr:hypothetical protein [Pontibacillus halophilus]
MYLSSIRANGILQQIINNYRSSREVREKTQQPFFKTGEEVHSLKGEVYAFLFAARGILDTISTLVHFLYGPSSSQFSSFVDYVKFLKSDKENKVFEDKEMLDYIENEMDWFWVLKDLRDQITHIGSLDFDFHEKNQVF